MQAQHCPICGSVLSRLDFDPQAVPIRLAWGLKGRAQLKCPTCGAALIPVLTRWGYLAVLIHAVLFAGFMIAIGRDASLQSSYVPLVIVLVLVASFTYCYTRWGHTYKAYPRQR